MGTHLDKRGVVSVLGARQLTGDEGSHLSKW